MWDWGNEGKAVPLHIILLILFLVTSIINIISCIRYVRRRHLWPLSSPDATRHPYLIVGTVIFLSGWALLHLVRNALDAHMPCAAYAFTAGFILQSMCMFFELRLYSLLFLFECTENLCNMNEHRKQRAAIAETAQQDKLDAHALLGMQLQSPPHSQLILTRQQQRQVDLHGTQCPHPNIEMTPLASPPEPHNGDAQQLHPLTNQLVTSIGADAATSMGSVLLSTHSPLLDVRHAEDLRPISSLILIHHDGTNHTSSDQDTPSPIPLPSIQTSGVAAQQTRSIRRGERLPIPSGGNRVIAADSISAQVTPVSANPSTPSLRVPFSSDQSLPIQQPSPPAAWATLDRNGASAVSDVPSPTPNHRGSTSDINAALPVSAMALSPVARYPGVRFAVSPDSSSPIHPTSSPMLELMTPIQGAAIISAVDTPSQMVDTLHSQPKGNFFRTTSTSPTLVPPLIGPVDLKESSRTSPRGNQRVGDSPGADTRFTHKSVSPKTTTVAIQAQARRSYLLPNWFVQHRFYTRVPFQLRWMIGCHILLFILLLILTFTLDHDQSYMYENNSWINNLQCNVHHVPGLQLIWSIVGMHILFMSIGLWHLWDRFPMDGFQIKKELYALALLTIPCILIHLLLPDSLEKQLSSIPLTATAVQQSSAGGVFIGALGDQLYFYTPNDSCVSNFSWDTLFNILLPFCVSILMTEGVLYRIVPMDDTTELIPHTISSNGNRNGIESGRVILMENDVVSSLDELLATKYGFASFFNFLKTEFTMQNLLYWRACKNFHIAIDNHRYLVRYDADSHTFAGGGMGGGSRIGAGAVGMGAGNGGGMDIMSGGFIGGVGMNRIPAILIGGGNFPTMSAVSGGNGSSDENAGIGTGTGSSGEKDGHTRNLLSEVGFRQMGLASGHIGRTSPRNSVLSLSVGTVGLRMGTYMHTAMLPNPSQITLGVPSKTTGHHRIRGEHMAPGAISPSHRSINAGGASTIHIPHMSTRPFNGPSKLHNNLNLASEGSTRLLSTNPTVSALLGGGVGAPLRGVRMHHDAAGNILVGGGVDVDAGISSDVRRAEAANPALRMARLHKHSQAPSMEQTRLHAMKLLEKARSIFDRFVRAGAPYEVTALESTLRSSIIQFMSLLSLGLKAPVDQVGDIAKIFTDSQEYVYTLMSTDAFPRYLQSKFFRDFKANARARAALQNVRIQKITMERAANARREELAAARLAMQSGSTDHSVLMSGPRHGVGFSRMPSGDREQYNGRPFITQPTIHSIQPITPHRPTSLPPVIGVHGGTNSIGVPKFVTGGIHAAYIGAVRGMGLSSDRATTLATLHGDIDGRAGIIIGAANATDFGLDHSAEVSGQIDDEALSGGEYHLQLHSTNESPMHFASSDHSPAIPIPTALIQPKHMSLAELRRPSPHPPKNITAPIGSKSVTPILSRSPSGALPILIPGMSATHNIDESSHHVGDMNGMNTGTPFIAPMGESGIGITNRVGAVTNPSTMMLPKPVSVDSGLGNPVLLSPLPRAPSSNILLLAAASNSIDPAGPSNSNFNNSLPIQFPSESSPTSSIMHPISTSIYSTSTGKVGSIQSTKLISSSVNSQANSSALDPHPALFRAGTLTLHEHVRDTTPSVKHTSTPSLSRTHTSNAHINQQERTGT
jgi:hypothetical protein